MKVYWSPSEHGFFHEGIQYNPPPTDLIEIGEARWQELMEAQREGWQIYTNQHGEPDLKKRE